jgi:hypothetical protein
MLLNQAQAKPLPEDPELILRGLRELYQNPYYRYLLEQLAVEEITATAEVFQVLEPASEHFKNVGLTLGLVRLKDIHLGKIKDLEETIKEQNAEQNVDVTKS